MNKEEEMQQMQLLLTSMSGMDTNIAINNIEAQGRNNILSKTQLPIYASKINDKRFWKREDSKELVKKEYKGYELVKAISEGKINEGTKFNMTKESTFLNEKVMYNGTDLIYINSGKSIFNDYFFTTILHLTFTLLAEEKKKEILNDEEKQYLSNFIRPFRNNVEWMEKVKKYDPDREYIQILINTDEEINLPSFEAGEMYKGMEANKRYEIEELGI